MAGQEAREDSGRHTLCIQDPCSSLGGDWRPPRGAVLLPVIQNTPCSLVCKETPPAPDTGPPTQKRCTRRRRNPNAPHPRSPSTHRRLLGASRTWARWETWDTGPGASSECCQVAQKREARPGAELPRRVSAGGRRSPVPAGRGRPGVERAAGPPAPSRSLGEQHPPARAPGRRLPGPRCVWIGSSQGIRCGRRRRPRPGLSSQRTAGTTGTETRTTDLNRGGASCVFFLPFFSLSFDTAKQHEFS